MPSPRTIRWVAKRLERLHGVRRRRRTRESILDGLVATILSQNTTNTNSERAFAALKRTFVTWDQVRRARVSTIERAISSGGLAKIKARRIKAILDTTQRERGATSLEHLRRRPSRHIKQVLGCLPGVGPKTIACVLLFTLGRDEFPVDTHVHRIARRLGWVGQDASAEQTYDALGGRVPAELRYSLHVLLVHHGRQICRAQRPKCGDCPLLPRCPHGQVAVMTPSDETRRSTPARARSARVAGSRARQ